MASLCLKAKYIAYFRDAEGRHRDADLLVSRHACTSFHSSSANWCRCWSVLKVSWSIQRQLLTVWSCRWGLSFIYGLVNMAQRGFGVEAYTEISQFYFFLKLRARRLLLGYAAKIRKFRSSTDLDKNFLFSFFKHGDPCLNKQAGGNTEGRVHNKAWYLGVRCLLRKWCTFFRLQGQ